MNEITLHGQAVSRYNAELERLANMIASYNQQNKPVAATRGLLLPRLQKNQPISAKRPSYPQARPSPVAGNPGSDAMQRHRPGVFYVEGLYKP